MGDSDELRELRERVEQLTVRVNRLEETVETSLVQPTSTPSPTGINTAAKQLPRLQSRPTQDLAGSLNPEQESLERRIGSQWLNRVGVVAVLVGVSYFLKLAFDSGWIDAGKRVLIGLIAGTGMCWWSERFRRPASIAFSYSLKAVGIGVLYLSLWASFQLYQLVPASVAFVAMLLVTAVSAALAVVQNAELLAGLALLGGLLTPVLCNTHENHEGVLFGYLLLLALGASVLQRVKPWPRILFGAFVGCFLLGAEWFDRYYTNDQFAESLLWFSLLFALFAVAPMYAILEPERDRTSRFTGLLIAVLNAAAYFGAIYSQLETSGGAVQSRAAAYAVGLAILYAALGVALDRRVDEHAGEERLMPIVHYGLAVSFVTIGVALSLHQHWMTVRRRVKLFAMVVVGLGVVRLLTLDLYGWGVLNPVLNARLMTFAVAVCALLWMIYLDYQSPDRDRERNVMAVAVVLVNVLALLAAGLEIHDTFARMISGTVLDPRNPASYDMAQARRGLAILRSFSYSALAMLYGAALIWVGFARRSALLRWQAIVLIAATVVKVFVFDTSALDHVWRVLSFIVLGVLLLGISYAYQRDWLGLQRPGPD